MSERLALIAGTTDPHLRRTIAENLKVPPLVLNGMGREFGGNDRIENEFVMRMPMVGWNNPVVIVQSTFNTRSFEELYQMTDAVAGANPLSVAGRPILLVPHFANARQDKRSPIGTAKTAELKLIGLEGAGASMLITLDLHNEQTMDVAKRMLCYNVHPTEILAQAVTAMNPGNPIFIGPDYSALRRASEVALFLDYNNQWGFFDKNRDPRLGDSITEGFHGDNPKGKFGIIIDDLLSSGGSAIEAGEKLLELGAVGYGIITTHGPIVQDFELGMDAEKRIQESNASWVCYTDSLPQPDWVYKKGSKIHVIPSGAFLAKVIEEVMSRDFSRGRLFAKK